MVVVLMLEVLVVLGVVLEGMSISPLFLCTVSVHQNSLSLSNL